MDSYENLKHRAQWHSEKLDALQDEEGLKEIIQTQREKLSSVNMYLVAPRPTFIEKADQILGSLETSLESVTKYLGLQAKMQKVAEPLPIIPDTMGKEFHGRIERLEADLKVFEKKATTLEQRALISNRRQELNNIGVLVDSSRASSLQGEIEKRLSTLEQFPGSAGQHDVHLKADLAQQAQTTPSHAEELQP